ncbi:MAG TPA: hypothetical protein VGD88_15990 [Opitutaceae bacterium]
MKTDHNEWLRLVAAARRAPADSRSTAAPYGFSTRVAALAMAGAVERPLSALFERLSLRAIGVAGLLAAVSVAANLPPVLQALEDDVLAVQDPVVEVLAFDISS